jgi:hypothetical protein
LAAIAADKAVRALDASEPSFWLSLAAVQVLALFGYGCSSLHEWAGWVDDTGGQVAVLERRLKIVQRMLIGLLAGNGAYFGGFYYYALAQVLCFGAAAAAAYGGDKVLAIVFARFTGRIQQGG